MVLKFLYFEHFTVSEARILSELKETKNELQRIKERMSIGTPTVHKNLSLISLVPKWSGLDSGDTLEEFFANIKTSAKLGRWQENDQSEIAVMRLAGSAKLFYQGCTELHEEGTTWQMFKNEFRRRYKETHTDQYHFAKLQTTRQARNKSPQEFADRCRSLAQKVIGKSDDPQIQRVHRENVERMQLSSFISGLHGVPGRQVRISNPQDIDQSLKIAITLQEAERQERFNEAFTPDLISRYASVRGSQADQFRKQRSAAAI